MSKPIAVKVSVGSRIRIPSAIATKLGITNGDYVVLNWNADILSVKKLHLSKVLDL